MILVRSEYLALVAVLFASFLFTPDAVANTPRLVRILPRGICKGEEHTLRFVGERLQNTQEVFLYDQGIEVLEIKQVDARQLDVKVRVAEDCRLGEHVAQVRTTRGISDYRSVYVGNLKETQETEPNNSTEAANAVSFNETVNGRVRTEDVDFFSIDAKQGQRLSVEIEAIRLGYMFDPFIAVLDSNRFELAVSDDSALHRQDGFISLIIPEDGTYYVMVRESSYGGDDNCRYRLHIGDFPRPSVAYPAGGKRDSTTDVKFLGDPRGEISNSIEVKDVPGLRGGLFPKDEFGVSPSPVAFRVSDLENVLEVEPNDQWNKLELATSTLPAAFNGIIEKQGDRDYFRFSAKKGQVFDFDCFARRIRSGLDPVMNIFDKDHKSLVGNDDARRPDAYLRFTAPYDGEYFLRIRDHLYRGQSDFVYRVEVTNIKPSLWISIPRVDRYSQLRQQIVVAKGNRFATRIGATRQNFGGQLKLIEEGLPAGIKMHAMPMVPNLNLMPVVFEATEDAVVSGSLVDFKAGLFDPNKPDQPLANVGSFVNRADFALGVPNNSLYYGCAVDKLPMAITERLPFKIDIVQPKVPLVRGGYMNLKVVVTRDEGFDQPIRLQFPFRPPGLGTKPQVVIPQGKNEITYPLNANGNAQLGTWPVYVIGSANVAGGPAWASTQLASLEIAAPFVTMEIKRSDCERGSETMIFCKLNQHQSFEGEAKAEILGIPPHIEIAPLTFKADTKELAFKVKTNDKSPLGKHRGLFCRATITQNGEPIVSVAGRSELQIKKPKPVPKPPSDVAGTAKPKAKAPAQPPAAKPMSRLEKLREAARQRAQTQGTNQ